MAGALFIKGSSVRIMHVKKMFHSRKSVLNIVLTWFSPPSKGHILA